MRAIRALVTLGLVWSVLEPSALADTELKNDSFSSGDAVTVQGGFAMDEAAASRFLPPEGSHKLSKVQFFFGGANSSEQIDLQIFDDSALTTNPGAGLFLEAYNVQASDSQLQEIDLSEENITVSGPFRVSIVFSYHSGAPSIANDTDSSSPTYSDRNFILLNGSTWVQSSSLGVSGDWIVRAFVEDDSSSGSGGSSGNGSGGSSEAGAGGSSGNGGTTAEGGAALGSGGATSSAAECKVNSECPNGRYCNASGVCDYDCLADIDCADGTQCGSLGQCEAVSGTSAQTTPTDGNSGCSVQAASERHSLLGFLGVLGFVVSLRRGSARRR